VGHYAAKRQFQSMSAAQARQPQIDKAQAAQAAQATEAAGQGKDITQQLQDLAALKQKGILWEEEFQQMIARIISNI
jgi:hypothetical protein